MQMLLNDNALRIALFIFNFVFAILSVALVALGVVYMDDLWWPRNFLYIEFLELPTFIIVLGCLSFLSSIVGCLCAKSHNSRLFAWFIGSLSILILMEIGITAIAFMNYKGDRENYTVIEMVKHLSAEEEYVPSFYEIEEHYTCCGIHGIEDYIQHLYVPKACCMSQYMDNVDVDDANCTIEASPTKEFTLSGCLYAVIHEIRRISFEIAYYISALTILQIVELFCAVTLVLTKSTTPGSLYY